MKYQTALTLMAFLAVGGCSASTATAPSRQQAPPVARADLPGSLQSVARSGALNVRKECSAYTGHAGEICTITSSNLKEIEKGSTITYKSDAVNGFLDTDVVLDLPEPGNNQAFGHCTLSLITGIGVCTLAGGTGKFTHFQARVDVTPLGRPNFAWDGSYSYGR